MRKFVIVNIILIIIFLVAICIVEDLIVTNSVREVNEDCMAIEELIDGREDLRTMDIVMAVENLEYNWMKNESKMCYLVNHKSIQEIGVEISKLKGFLENNEFISSANIDIVTLWESIKEELAKEVSMLTFDVWITSLEVIDIKETS